MASGSFMAFPPASPIATVRQCRYHPLRAVLCSSFGLRWWLLAGAEGLG